MQKKRACITAISGKTNHSNGFRPEYDGENLIVYPGYTEFRPVEPIMNLSEKQFTGFTPHDEKSPWDQKKKNDLHYDIKKTRYDYDDNLKPHQLGAMLQAESRVYAKGNGGAAGERTPRGEITHISRKSATRLKKLMCRAMDISLWIDLTFSDDVFDGMTFQERMSKSYACLNEFQRYIKKQGIFYIWKKEIKVRLSGALKGCRIPHYHVALCCLSDKQKADYEKFAILLLSTWVSITGTKNPKAMEVALHRKNGVPSSFRRIENIKSALRYIGKYFGKTENSPDHKPESIGRAWGYSKDLPQSEGIKIGLNREESTIVRRLMRKALRLKKNKRFIGCLEQIKCGYSTFLFCCEDLPLRLSFRYAYNPQKKIDLVPF